MDKKKAILLRISPELWDALNVWARDELRSVNAQIEYVLREAARKRGVMREEPTTQADPAQAAPGPPTVPVELSAQIVTAIVDAVLAPEDRPAAIPPSDAASADLPRATVESTSPPAKPASS